MKQVHFILLTGIFLFNGFNLAGQPVKVGLFNSKTIQTFIFSPMQGEYALEAASRKNIKLNPGTAVYIALIGNKLSVRDMQGNNLMEEAVNLTARDSACQFSLRPAFPAMEARQYQGSCRFRADIGRIEAINIIPEDYYLAAVVAAEGGTSASPEFYKAQAILCRTYLLAHFSKHETDSFNVCDEVHCQAYKGMNSRNPAILQAVIATHGEVAVYADTILITAAYHANCGGETQSAENEWLQKVPYLKGKEDPWCSNTKSSYWHTEIPREKWIAYLRANGIHLQPPTAKGVLDFTQDTRQAYYRTRGDSLALRKIRADWNFRSSFFSVQEEKGDSLLISGKGFGHGVGMCQTGAINMAAHGKTCEEILSFYFEGIRVRNIMDLPAGARLTGSMK